MVVVTRGFSRVLLPAQSPLRPEATRHGDIHSQFVLHFPSGAFSPDLAKTRLEAACTRLYFAYFDVANPQVSMPAIEIPRTNFRNRDCTRRRDNRRDVKPAPKANRAKGPKLLADAAPTK